MTGTKNALRLSILVFAAGIALVAIFHIADVKDAGTTLVTLLLVPLLVYAIASGILAEFSAPGGWSAKFRAAVEQKAETSATPISSAPSLQKVEKRSATELVEIIRGLEKGRPVSLMVRLDKRNYYKASLTKMYIQSLLAFDTDLAIILIDDKSGKFVAMVDASAFMALLEAHSSEVIRAIEQNDIAYFRQFPQFVFEGISQDATNGDALRKMTKLNRKMLVVLTDNKQPHAIVKRDDIVAGMLEKLTAA
jgi:hypothetical protein